MKSLLICLCLLFPGLVSASAWLDAGEIRGPLPLKTWKDLRDAGIEKQDRDFSCGAAALATLLRGYFGINATEESVLAGLPERAWGTSFRSLADLAATHYGLAYQGLALDFDTLRRLRTPALVYLRVRGRGHFSVLRGIDAAGRVWLADPSWGNRLLASHRFLSLWRTREDPELPGKILLLSRPQGQASDLNPEFFVTRSLRDAIRRPAVAFAQTD